MYLKDAFTNITATFRMRYIGSMGIIRKEHRKHAFCNRYIVHRTVIEPYILLRIGFNFLRHVLQLSNTDLFFSGDYVLNVYEIPMCFGLVVCILC